jgi:hypothetical protein
MCCDIVEIITMRARRQWGQATHPGWAGLFADYDRDHFLVVRGVLAGLAETDGESGAIDGGGAEETPAVAGDERDEADFP